LIVYIFILGNLIMSNNNPVIQTLTREKIQEDSKMMLEKITIWAKREAEKAAQQPQQPAQGN